MSADVSVQTESPAAHADLEELRRPMLVGLCVTGLAVAWLWTSIAATIEDQPTAIKVLAPPGLLLVACSTCLVLTQAPMRWRCWLFLSGLCGTLSLGYVVAPAPIWAYCGVLAVSIASLLAGPGASFIVAFLLSSVVLGLSQMLPPAAGAVDLYLALGLVCATAVVSWLSSRNLYTVLHWAMYSQARAWETARELRGRRQQLRRTLTSLRNAHAVLARTTRELEDARLEAEEARRVKSRFVSNISHELRTPLNIIVGFAEMLCTSPETYGDPDWPPALREDLFTIWRNAEHLLSMVDDVLDLAQIEAARLPIVPERTDLAQLIRDTLVTASALIRESGLDLRVSLPPKLGDLDIDRTRIRQVLLNLINNAVRFTSEGHIEIGAWRTEREVVIYVRDSGEGIPADKLDVIFEEFGQVDDSIRRSNQGRGLGLTISRHFVRLHGGRMWVESEVGKGSTFYFTLPLPGKKTAVQPVHPRRSWPQVPRPEDTPETVVVVSSDPLVARILRRHLGGQQVLTATSPPEAIQEGKRILDSIAPIDLPVLACKFPTERQASVSLGVPEFLIKPVTAKDVVSAVRRLSEHPRRILIVDDEPDMLRLLERIVHQEWEAAEVLTATSGEEAIAQLPLRPEVILLDLLMPGMSGLDMLEMLRADPDASHIPVVVITARGPAEDIARAQRGEAILMRNSSLTAGELMRLLQLVTKAVPPHYVTGGAGPRHTPVASPA